MSNPGACKPLRVCVAHNRYQQLGGEDRVVAAEVEMLRRYGHEVEVLSFDNDAIHGEFGKAMTALHSAYSVSSFRCVERALRAIRPDVLHVHNFAPTLSPSVFFAAAKMGVPVVQTLHNYRLQCANAQFFRDGEVCERCLESRSFLPGVQFGCYRGSRMGSAVMGATIALHGALGTWEHRITRYIALTDFAAAKLGSFRLPADRIRVKPNFVADRGVGTGRGGYALFVGRLAKDKGLDTLLAPQILESLPFPLYLAGDGPLRDKVDTVCERSGGKVIACGAQTAEQVLDLMRNAAVLLVPSVWYEGFPMVIAEALSVGLPVIASRIGGLPEIVKEGTTGLLHRPGDPASLLHALEKFAALALPERDRMRVAARARYLEHFSEERNYEQLLEIYQEAMEEKRRAPALLAS